MVSTLLYYTYGLVMTGALACFVQAFRVRRNTPRHKRWAVSGVAMAFGGIVVVVLVTYLFGYRPTERFPEVVLWHRRMALAATVVMILTAVSGARRWRIHKRLYVLLFPLYTATIISAAIGYGP